MKFVFKHAVGSPPRSTFLLFFPLTLRCDVVFISLTYLHCKKCQELLHMSESPFFKGARAWNEWSQPDDWGRKHRNGKLKEKKSKNNILE